ncbi:MAG: triose-phosphate isomerase [Bacteroidales bacterium]|nr:triose-phosphate isomerase [Bacteroidales bacterium]
MRNKIVAGNWKMNKTFDEADTLIDDLIAQTKKLCELKNTTVIICPPYLYLEVARDKTIDTFMNVGAQNLSEYSKGAYTGEVSASMLESMGIEYCIIGHSERRKYFAESDEQLYKKVLEALKNNIFPIFCCGELLEERESGNHFEVVRSQLKNTILKLDKIDFGNVIIAYEPVWAIGTGKTATSGQAQEMHEFIRNLISEKYDKLVAASSQILYGGSCNSKNAAELFSMSDVDGGLIGGASLDAAEFMNIINSAESG